MQGSNCDGKEQVQRREMAQPISGLKVPVKYCRNRNIGGNELEIQKGLGKEQDI